LNNIAILVELADDKSMITAAHWDMDKYTPIEHKTRWKAILVLDNAPDD